MQCNAIFKIAQGEITDYWNSTSYGIRNGFIYLDVAGSLFKETGYINSPNRLYSIRIGATNSEFIYNI